jgi:hypothetical protein
MASYDAFKTKLFRTDAGGRRVIAPFGPRGDVVYVDDDAKADRVATGIYRARLFASAVMGFSFFAIVWSPFMILGIPLAGVARRAYIRKLLSGFPRAAIRAQDLPPVDRATRVAAYNAAYGRRNFVGLAVAGGLIAALGAFRLIVLRSGEARASQTVFEGVGLALLGLACIVTSARAIRTIPPSP